MLDDSCLTAEVPRNAKDLVVECLSLMRGEQHQLLSS